MALPTSGFSTPKDFETLMQLLYLQFEQPRFDREAFTALKGRFAGLAANMANDPQKVISDSLQLILTDHNKRTRLITPAFIEELSLEQMENIYRDRIADAGDFTFFIVGNLEEPMVKQLVEKYIGSPDNFEKILESLTVEEIRNFTAGFLQTADLVDVVFLPVKR